MGLHPRAGPGWAVAGTPPAKVREAHGTEACGRRRSWAVRGEGPRGRAARLAHGTVGLEGWWWVVSSPDTFQQEGRVGAGGDLGARGRQVRLVPFSPGRPPLLSSCRSQT